MIITDSKTYKTDLQPNEHVGHKCPRCGDIGFKIYSDFTQDFDEHGVFGYRTVTCIECDDDRDSWQEHYDMREIILL